MKNLKSIILVMGLLIMITLGLYPPWVYQGEDGKQTPMGYSFIWAPPEIERDKSANFFGFKIDLEVGAIKANSLDIYKLLIEELIAAGITFGGATVAGNSAKSEQKRDNIDSKNTTD